MLNLRYSLSKLKDSFFYGDFVYYLTKGKVFPPYYVLWDCTRRCNLHCSHCGAIKEKYKTEMTTEQVKNLINQLAQIGVKFFAATGGEPLLRKDLLEIMKYASEKEIGTGFATNGFFISPEIAKKIKEAGISSIQVSLDGTEEIHNKIRGNSQSFQKAIGAIKLLQKEKIKMVSAATTLTPMNFDCMEELRDILVKSGVKKWRICVVMPIGRAEKKQLMLNPTQLRHLLEFVSANKENISIQIGENLPFLAEYERKIRKAPNVCPVGFSACCIGVDGNVRGCPEMPDTEKFREGNVLQNPFMEIWAQGFRRYRQREAIKTDSRCAKCKDKEDCFGGCRVMREGKTQCIYDLLKENK